MTTGAVYATGSRTGRLSSAAAIVGLHALVLGLLWQLEPVRSAITSAPIRVSMLEPERPKAVTPPKPLPPKPKPVPVRQAAPKPRPTPVPQAAPAAAPIVTAAPSAPTPQVAPPAPPEPPPVVAPAPPPVTLATAPPPAPLTPARYNAAYLNNPPPAYPPISRRMGEEGKVLLLVHVTARGLADEVKLKTSSGYQRLDNTALETVRQWKFVPAKRGDAPIDQWVDVPISFSLRSSS